MNTVRIPIAVFRLGRIVTTSNALECLTRQDILEGIRRHQAGDWGEVPLDQAETNDRALVAGTRIISVYRAANGPRFWIITEADRSATTVLMPEDY
jgi:hypothetical protein